MYLHAEDWAALIRLFSSFSFYCVAEDAMYLPLLNFYCPSVLYNKILSLREIKKITWVRKRYHPKQKKKIMKQKESRMKRGCPISLHVEIETPMKQP